MWHFDTRSWRLQKNELFVDSRELITTVASESANLLWRVITEDQILQILKGSDDDSNLGFTYSKWQSESIFLGLVTARCKISTEEYTITRVSEDSFDMVMRSPQGNDLSIRRELHIQEGGPFEGRYAVSRAIALSPDGEPGQLLSEYGEYDTYSPFNHAIPAVWYNYSESGELSRVVELIELRELLASETKQRTKVPVTGQKDPILGVVLNSGDDSIQEIRDGQLSKNTTGASSVDRDPIVSRNILAYASISAILLVGLGYILFLSLRKSDNASQNQSSI